MSCVPEQSSNLAGKREVRAVVRDAKTNQLVNGITVTWKITTNPGNWIASVTKSSKTIKGVAKAEVLSNPAVISDAQGTISAQVSGGNNPTCKVVFKNAQTAPPPAGSTVTPPADSTITPTVSPPRACVAGNTDTFLVIDRSNSMRLETSNQIKTPRLDFAKKAAVSFVNSMSQETTNYIGIAQFGKNGGVNQNLTNDYAQVKTTINKLEADGPIGTCLECAILSVNERITTRIKAGNKNKKFVIILSDGNANIVKTEDGSLSDIDRERGINQARRAILAGHQSNGTVYYTIGLGQEKNADGRAFLQEVATATKGKYFFAANASQLEKIYQEIALTVGKVSVSGVTFEDKNTNGIFEPNIDASMSGVTLNLNLASSNASSPNSGNIATTKSDANGKYTFSNLCADKYHVTQAEKDGYYLTVPQNPPYYLIDTDTALTDFTDKNFGNAKGEVTFSFKFALHGIGIAGDNVLLRPAPCQNFGFKSDECLSNQSPRHPNRKFTVEVIDSLEKTVASLSGTMSYNARTSSNSGIFTAKEKLTTGIKKGQYTFRISTPMFLKKKIIFDQEIETNKTYELPIADLTSSDVETVSSPNRLTILDYNMIVTCYNLPNQTKKSCNPTDSEKVDTDDDGDNDEFDINLFTRDISTQFGD